MSEAATSDDFKLFQRHFPVGCTLVHTLSSSETGNIALSRWSHGDTVTEGKLPVGLITKGHEILFRNKLGDPVPPGEVGEIVITSHYIAAGYWRNPELTAARFSCAGDGSGRRVFRTGDLARVNARGHLEFIGRRDDRVKVRGNRISLSDIEHALHRLPGIERAVVEAVPRDGLEPLLVGFVAVRDEQSWSQPSLRRALRIRLPEYMVPSEFAILREFPLTSAGKVDRSKLRHEFRPQRQRSGTPPVTTTEHLLGTIWAEVFEIDSIDRDEDFFSLGGDSLIAALVSASIHEALGVQLDLAMFTENATLAELASVIDKLHAERAEASIPLAPAKRLEPAPVSFAQERIWRISQVPSQAGAYTMTRIYRISGPLDSGVLRDCMNLIAQRHEMLRTSFVAAEPLPVQIVNAPVPTALTCIDLRGDPDPEAHALVIFGKAANRVFDLTQAPLLQFSLIRLRDNEHWLLRVSHHILSDNVSWELYFSELAQTL